jgi:hypothetical protein
MNIPSVQNSTLPAWAVSDAVLAMVVEQFDAIVLEERERAWTSGVSKCFGQSEVERVIKIPKIHHDVIPWMWLGRNIHTYRCGPGAGTSGASRHFVFFNFNSPGEPVDFEGQDLPSQEGPDHSYLLWINPFPADLLYSTPFNNVLPIMASGGHMHNFTTLIKR